MIPYITHFWNQGFFILFAVSWNDEFRGICLFNLAIGQVSEEFLERGEQDDTGFYE